MFEKRLRDDKMENLESKNKEDKLCLRQQNQDFLTQIKKLKHDKKYLQEELDSKRSLIDKETMTNPIEKLLDVQISTSEKGTTTEPVDTPIRKNPYSDKSLQTSRKDDSKEQSQEISLR